jgi:thiamine-monophosphate kinase
MTNEFELIARMRERLSRRGDRVVVWSGDDAAAVRPGGAVSVTSIDSFVEGVHFRLVTTSLRDLGHKCIAASLSDLAAMGASPGEAYIALGLPHHLGEREVLELADGAEALAAECGVTICGGDVSRADELFVAVTVVGYVEAEERLARRDAARPGDVLGVTGTLGGSSAGLLLLERKHHGGDLEIDLEAGKRLLERHLRPFPQVSAGRALVAAGVHAMIDVSDGIASDAARICERSGVAAEVQLADLPVEEGVAEVARDHGLDPLELAAAGGEDYELLFTAPTGRREDIERAAGATDIAVSWIGRILPGPADAEEAVRLLDASGRRRRLRGWDHLSPANVARESPERA